MAKIGVSLKIDVTKINKEKLFKGQKGVYLDMTAFIDLDELDQYGNSGMIVQSVSKEDRENGVRGEILGNSKIFFKDTPTPENAAPEPSVQDEYPDDVPF